MSSVPDLMNLLALAPKLSKSPFGGQHRTIFIQRDYTNIGDFVFNSLIQNFNRKEPKTPVLLITLHHDWINYSASAAKCGFNLRRAQNSGQFDNLNIMSKISEIIKSDESEFDPCDYILKHTSSFIKTHSAESQSDIAGARMIKPVVIMIDDLSTLLTLGCRPNQIFRLFSLIDKSLRDRSKGIQTGQLSHFIVQTLITNIKPKVSIPNDDNLNYLVSNIENLSDISLTIKPLDTGYSTRVDGTIKIVDNRIPSSQETSSSKQQLPLKSPFPERNAEIGMKKAYFFKIGDRRVRLTTSALIF